MKKFLSMFLLSILFIFGLSSFDGKSLAATTQDGEEKIIDVYEAEGTDGATITFVDNSLVGKSRIGNKGNISTLALEKEVYSHSYYVYNSGTITAYNSGPLTNQKFLISVARGQTKTLSSSISVSGTVSYSGSIEAELYKVIKVGLTSNVSGTVSTTFNTSTTYKGPAAPYTTRDYYGAVQYDTYKTTVTKYNVYKVYNGSAYLNNRTYNVGTITTSNVKKPKIITTMRDFTN